MLLTVWGMLKGTAFFLSMLLLLANPAGIEG
jgi:hypothetical protein